MSKVESKPVHQTKEGTSSPLINRAKTDVKFLQVAAIVAAVVGFVLIAAGTAALIAGAVITVPVLLIGAGSAALLAALVFGLIAYVAKTYTPEVDTGMKNKEFKELAEIL